MIINSRSFYKYVRPQINNIINDYNKAIELVNKSIAPLILIRKKIDSLIVGPHTDNKNEKLKKIAAELNELLIKKKFQRVDLVNRFIKIEYRFTKREDLQDFHTSFNLFLLENLPQEYSTSFSLLWVGFIKPLQKYTYLNHDQGSLKKKVTEYNSNWNSFLVVMTKRGKKLSRPLSERLEVIHRRWRSILKIIIVP